MTFGATNEDDDSSGAKGGAGSRSDGINKRKFVAVHGLENTQMFYEGEKCVETGNKAQGVVQERHYDRNKKEYYWEGEPVKEAVWLGMKRVLTDEELEGYKYEEFSG